ncbi:MAG: hypothetical protein HGB10_02055 [Coriobacteriia bacterium]|nr:hypothetical protein [Coriobacteriia bacterium]
MTHELRRQDREITDPAEIDRLLTGARYATIALADGDSPYVVTLSCGYDRVGSRLCFHVAPAGRKLDIIARNAHGCATVIEDCGYKHGQCAHPFRSVVLAGSLRVIDNPAETRDAMRVLIGQLESAQDAETIFERNSLDDDAALARFRMLVFDIESMTAKEGE